MTKTVVASGNFLVPNATFIAELVAFVVIVVIVGKYIAPFVSKTIAARQAIVRQQMEDAAKAKQDLADAEKRYSEALTEARTEAAKIRESARAEAQRTTQEVKVQAREESARILARGEEQLERQRGAIVRELRSEIGTLAVELSEKIVDQQLANDSQVRATVDAFLAGLEAHDVAQSGSQ